MIARSHKTVGEDWQESRRYFYSTRWQLLEEQLKTPATDGQFLKACEYVWGLRGPDDLILRDRFDVAGSGGERLFAINDAMGHVTGLLGTTAGGCGSR